MARVGDLSLEVQRLAYEGRLIVWGRKKGAGEVFLKINPEFWEEHGLDELEVFKLSDPESLSTEPKTRWPDDHSIYDSLKVNRAQVRKLLRKPGVGFLLGGSGKGT